MKRLLLLLRDVVRLVVLQGLGGLNPSEKISGMILRLWERRLLLLPGRRIGELRRSRMPSGRLL